MPSVLGHVRGVFLPSLKRGEIAGSNSSKDIKAKHNGMPNLGRYQEANRVFNSFVAGRGGPVLDLIWVIGSLDIHPRKPSALANPSIEGRHPWVGGGVSSKRRRRSVAGGRMIILSFGHKRIQEIQ